MSSRIVKFTSQIVFECTSKACAPPPIGTGGSKGGGGGSAGGGSARSPRIAKGKRVTIKGDDGKSIGTVRRDSKGRLTYEHKEGRASGSARNYSEAVAGLKAAERSDKRIKHMESPAGRKEARAKAAADNQMASPKYLGGNLAPGMTVSQIAPLVKQTSMGITVKGRKSNYSVDTTVSRGKTRYQVIDTTGGGRRKVGGSVGKKTGVKTQVAKDLQQNIIEIS